MDQLEVEEIIHKKYRIFKADFTPKEVKLYSILFFLVALFGPYIAHVAAGTVETIQQADLQYDMLTILVVGFPLYFGICELGGFVLVALLKTKIPWERLRRTRSVQG